jgi:hypothetical protein
MAKEYFSVKNQRIEFDSDRLTMTVTMHDDKFTVMSVQTLTEPEFNSQYFRFKAEMYSTMATQQSGIRLSAEDTMRLQNLPEISNFDDFIQMKETALTVLNSMIFASGSAQ